MMCPCLVAQSYRWLNCVTLRASSEWRSTGSITADERPSKTITCFRWLTQLITREDLSAVAGIHSTALSAKAYSLPTGSSSSRPSAHATFSFPTSTLHTSTSSYLALPYLTLPYFTLLEYFYGLVLPYSYLDPFPSALLWLLAVPFFIVWRVMRSFPSLLSLITCFDFWATSFRFSTVHPHNVDFIALRICKGILQTWPLGLIPSTTFFSSHHLTFLSRLLRRCTRPFHPSKCIAFRSYMRHHFKTLRSLELDLPESPFSEEFPLIIRFDFYTFSNLLPLIYFLSASWLLQLTKISTNTWHCSFTVGHNHNFFNMTPSATHFYYKHWGKLNAPLNST